MLAVLAITAVCLSPPVSGPMIAEYAPAGRYAGHWGVDYAAGPGEPVEAPADGVVTFAGSVAGMLSLTIEPVPGFKVSLSYLSMVSVGPGDHVQRGVVVGRAGAPHGVPGVHLSTRLAGRYTDPASQMGCRDTDISRALRLVTPPRPYARRRANRNIGRNLRPHPYRSSPRRRFGSTPTRSGSGPHRARG